MMISYVILQLFLLLGLNSIGVQNAYSFSLSNLNAFSSFTRSLSNTDSNSQNSGGGPNYQVLQPIVILYTNSSNSTEYGSLFVRQYTPLKYDNSVTTLNYTETPLDGLYCIASSMSSACDLKRGLGVYLVVAFEEPDGSEPVFALFDQNFTELGRVPLPDGVIPQSVAQLPDSTVLVGTNLGTYRITPFIENTFSPFFVPSSLSPQNVVKVAFYPSGPAGFIEFHRILTQHQDNYDVVGFKSAYIRNASDITIHQDVKGFTNTSAAYYRADHSVLTISQWEVLYKTALNLNHPASFEPPTTTLYYNYLVDLDSYDNNYYVVFGNNFFLLRDWNGNHVGNQVPTIRNTIAGTIAFPIREPYEQYKKLVVLRSTQENLGDPYALYNTSSRPNVTDLVVDIYTTHALVEFEREARSEGILPPASYRDFNPDYHFTIKNGYCQGTDANNYTTYECFVAATNDLIIVLGYTTNVSHLQFGNSSMPPNDSLKPALFFITPQQLQNHRPGAYIYIDPLYLHALNNQTITAMTLLQDRLWIGTNESLGYVDLNHKNKGWKLEERLPVISLQVSNELDNNQGKVLAGLIGPLPLDLLLGMNETGAVFFKYYTQYEYFNFAPLPPMPTAFTTDKYGGFYVSFDTGELFYFESLYATPEFIAFSPSVTTVEGDEVSGVPRSIVLGPVDQTVLGVAPRGLLYFTNATEVALDIGWYYWVTFGLVMTQQFHLPQSKDWQDAYSFQLNFTGNFDSYPVNETVGYYYGGYFYGPDYNFTEDFSPYGRVSLSIYNGTLAQLSTYSLRFQTGVVDVPITLEEDLLVQSVALAGLYCPRHPLNVTDIGNLYFRGCSVSEIPGSPELFGVFAYGPPIHQHWNLTYLNYTDLVFSFNIFKFHDIMELPAFNAAVKPINRWQIKLNNLNSTARAFIAVDEHTVLIGDGFNVFKFTQEYPYGKLLSPVGGNSFSRNPAIPLILADSMFLDENVSSLVVFGKEKRKHEHQHCYDLINVTTLEDDDYEPFCPTESCGEVPRLLGSNSQDGHDWSHDVGYTPNYNQNQWSWGWNCPTVCNISGYIGFSYPLNNQDYLNLGAYYTRLSHELCRAPYLEGASSAVTQYVSVGPSFADDENFRQLSTGGLQVSCNTCLNGPASPYYSDFTASSGFIYLRQWKLKNQDQLQLSDDYERAGWAQLRSVKYQNNNNNNDHHNNDHHRALNNIDWTQYGSVNIDVYEIRGWIGFNEALWDYMYRFGPKPRSFPNSTLIDSFQVGNATCPLGNQASCSFAIDPISGDFYVSAYVQVGFTQQDIVPAIFYVNSTLVNETDFKGTVSAPYVTLLNETLRPESIVYVPSENGTILLLYSGDVYVLNTTDGNTTLLPTNVHVTAQALLPEGYTIAGWYWLNETQQYDWNHNWNHHHHNWDHHDNDHMHFNQSGVFVVDPETGEILEELATRVKTTAVDLTSYFNASDIGSAIPYALWKNGTISSVDGQMKYKSTLNSVAPIEWIEGLPYSGAVMVLGTSEGAVAAFNGVTEHHFQGCYGMQYYDLASISPWNLPLFEKVNSSGNVFCPFHPTPSVTPSHTPRPSTTSTASFSSSRTPAPSVDAQPSQPVLVGSPLTTATASPGAFGSPSSTPRPRTHKVANFLVPLRGLSTTQVLGAPASQGILGTRTILLPLRRLFCQIASDTLQLGFNASEAPVLDAVCPFELVGVTIVVDADSAARIVRFTNNGVTRYLPQVANIQKTLPMPGVEIGVFVDPHHAPAPVPARLLALLEQRMQAAARRLQVHMTTQALVEAFVAFFDEATIDHPLIAELLQYICEAELEASGNVGNATAYDECTENTMDAIRTSVSTPVYTDEGPFAPPPTPAEDKDNTGLIIGLVVGLGGFVLIVLSVIVYMRRSSSSVHSRSGRPGVISSTPNPSGPAHEAPEVKVYSNPSHANIV